MVDILSHYGPLFLGSRLKRLGERLQTDVERFARSLGFEIQPGQFPLLAALDLQGPMTTGVAAEVLGVSQPLVTRTANALVGLGLVEARGNGPDRRVRELRLTHAGQALIEHAKAAFWPPIRETVEIVCASLSGSLLQQIGQLEARLDEESLERRINRRVSDSVEIIDFEDRFASDFYRVNAEWIEAMFSMEPSDRDTLENPRARILDGGGALLLARTASHGVIGTVALMRTSASAFELTKMAVLASARGQDVGKTLLSAAVERARAMQVETLYLLTNTKCAAAIHLYEQNGFQHDAGIMERYGRKYARCNVAMRYDWSAFAR